MAVRWKNSRREMGDMGLLKNGGADLRVRPRYPGPEGPGLRLLCSARSVLGQRLQVRGALHREFPGLFDEEVLHAADLRGFEDLRPVDGVLANREPTAAAATLRR